MTNFNPYLFPQTHLYASVYSVYIADWLAAFPRDQVHVIMFEEHIADEVNSINSICDFLEIREIIVTASFMTLMSILYLQQYFRNTEVNKNTMLYQKSRANLVYHNL